MTRRDFFRVGAIGGATVPGALRTVSAPVALKPLMLNGYMSGITAYTDRLVVAGNAILTRSLIVRPWSRGLKIHAPDGTVQAQIYGNTFRSADPPFWARVLRLGGR